MLQFVKKTRRRLFDVNLHDEAGKLHSYHTDPTQICADSERPLHSEALKMFQSVDVDSGGTLDIEEVRQLADKLGYRFTQKELQAAMKREHLWRPHSPPHPSWLIKVLPMRQRWTATAPGKWTSKNSTRCV